MLLRMGMFMADHHSLKFVQRITINTSMQTWCFCWCQCVVTQPRPRWQYLDAISMYYAREEMIREI